MDPLAAGDHGAALQPDLTQDRAQIRRRRPYRAEVEPRVRVKVEDQPVGPLEPVAPRPPDVKLDCAHLHRRQQRGGAGQHHAGLAVDLDPADGVGKALADVFLEEAFGLDPVRAAVQRHRPPAGMGEKPVGDQIVMPRDIGLGQTGVREDQPRRGG